MLRFSEAHETTWNHVRLRFAAGSELSPGELANYLLAGGAPLEEVAAPADEVPDAAVGKVLEWVGDDLERARAALDAEVAKGDAARTTLVTALEKLLTPAED